MEKVTIKALNSANLRMDNSVDTEREYEMFCNVSIENGSTVANIDSGSVVKNGAEIATFSSSSVENLQIGYNNVNSQEQCTIINAVNDFISEVRKKAISKSLIENINSL